MIRFIEKRFGVFEPSISPWRRAVCGDLTSLFDFNGPESLDIMGQLPPVRSLARRSTGRMDTWTPPTKALPELPFQRRGIRPSRKLPYELTVESRVDLVAQKLEIAFINVGEGGGRGFSCLRSPSPRAYSSPLYGRARRLVIGFLEHRERQWL